MTTGDNNFNPPKQEGRSLLIRAQPQEEQGCGGHFGEQQNHGELLPLTGTEAA